MIRWLAKIIPIAEFVVEDIKAKTRGQRRWDVLFSPLQVGKQWFYDQLELHRLQPEAGGVRSVYGSTRSHGLTRGSLVQHVKYGLTYVGGYMKDRLSLHDIATGKRLTQKAKPMDCRFRTYNTWRRFLRPLKGAVSTPQAI